MDQESDFEKACSSQNDRQNVFQNVRFEEFFMVREFISITKNPSPYDVEGLCVDLWTK